MLNCLVTLPDLTGLDNVRSVESIVLSASSVADSGFSVGIVWVISSEDIVTGGSVISEFSVSEASFKFPYSLQRGILETINIVSQ